jgi:hypothetical protein
MNKTQDVMNKSKEQIIERRKKILPQRKTIGRLLYLILDNPKAINKNNNTFDNVNYNDSNIYKENDDLNSNTLGANEIVASQTDGNIYNNVLDTKDGEPKRRGISYFKELKKIRKERSYIDKENTNNEKESNIFNL